ncbi:MAG: hypothetical protein ACOC90_06550 [Bacteroidota bacterium]
MFKKDIIKEKNVFFLERALPVDESYSPVEIAEIVKKVKQMVNEGGQIAENQKIEDSLWAVRRQILDQPRSAKKMALCISIDLAINKEYPKEDENRNLLKIISTLVVQYL